MFDSLETALRSAEEAMGAVDADRLLGTEPHEMLDLLIRHQRVTAALRLKVTARAEEMNQWRREGHDSYESWLAAKQGTSKGNAGRQKRNARNLKDCPETADALADGEISEEQAEIVADAASENPQAERELLDTAKNRHKSNNDLKDAAAKKKAEAEDDRARAERLRKGRSCTIGRDRDGFWTLFTKQQPHIGAALKSRIDDETDRIFNARRRAGEREPLDRYRADALASLILGHLPDHDPASASRAGGATSPASTDPTGDSGTVEPTLDFGPSTQSPIDDRPDSTIPADEAAADTATQPGGSGAESPPRRRPGRDLVLVVDLTAFRRGNVAAGETCEIKGIGPVPVEVARQWADDAFIKAVITDGRDVLHVAHLGRHIAADVRTGLMVIHDGCSVPGCSNQRIEYDHDHTVADDGLTNVANLRPLCTSHHRQRTHHGYELTGTPGDYVWTGPDGTVLAADDPRKTGPPVRAG